MVSVLALCEVDRGFEPRLGQIKGYKIGICFFPAKHEGVRAKTGWLGISTMCPSGTIYLYAECYLFL
jgi:hypothetical protein